MKPRPPADSDQPDRSAKKARRATDHPALRQQAQGGSAPAPAPKTPDWQAGTVIDRRTFPDRRLVADPRTGELVASKPATTHDDPSIAEPADVSGLERRRGRGRRLSDFTRRAEEGEMTSEQFLFLMAIDEFKKANCRTFPTWTDVLEIVRLLGYRKTMSSEINLNRAEDWLELPNTASNVRPKNWERRAAA